MSKIFYFGLKLRVQKRSSTNQNFLLVLHTDISDNRSIIFFMNIAPKNWQSAMHNWMGLWNAVELENWISQNILYNTVIIGKGSKRWEMKTNSRREENHIALSLHHKILTCKTICWNLLNKSTDWKFIHWIFTHRGLSTYPEFF